MRPLLALVLLAFTGCNPAPSLPGSVPATGEVLATTEAGPVTADMMSAVTRRMPDGALEEMKSTGQFDQLVERVAIGHVLYHRALAEGLHENPEVQKSIAMAARDVLAAELIENVASRALSDEALKAHYDEHQVQYARPQVHARHVLVKEESLADEIKKQLAEGADFAELAKQHSTDPGSAQEGGDLGWFEKRRMVTEFSDAAFAAEPGEVVGPIKTRFGFHVIEVLGKRDTIPLDEVKDQIEEQLKQKAVQDYIEGIKNAEGFDVKGRAVPPGAADAAADPHAGHGH